MPILQNPFNITFSRSQQVPASARRDMMFELTNLGRKEVDQLEGDESEFPIMSALHSRSMNIEDLNKETHLDINKVKFELKRLVRQGKVKTVNSSGE